MRFLSTLAALVAALLFAACSSDDTPTAPTNEGQPITLHLTLAAANGDEASTVKTRSSWSYESDDDYAEGEGLYSWLVLMVRPVTTSGAVTSYTIEKIFSSNTTLTGATPTYRSNLKEDPVATGLQTTTGACIFYNFANISSDEVIAATNGSITALTEGASLTTTQLSALDAATYAISGNGYDPTTTRTYTNSDGTADTLKGIPMSGRQEVDLNWTDHYQQTLTLWVVRMLAKMELQFTNATGGDVSVTSVSLSPLTANPGNTTRQNVKLLPNYTPQSNALTTTTTQLPRLNTTDGSDLDTETYTYTYAADAPLAIKSGEKGTLSFYVNESYAKYGDTYGYGQFLLTVNLKLADGTTTSQRYAFLTENADNDGIAEWNYIARNDHRVIPITLQNYKLSLVPYDYPPIGVLPSSAQEQDGTFTCTFHAGGDFHLVPTVTKYSTGEVVPISVGQDSNGAAKATWENLSYYRGTSATDASATTVEGSAIYSTLPVWASLWTNADGNAHYETGDYVHGTFQYGLTSSYTSLHRLTVNIAPADGSLPARTFIAPVILKYVP